DLEERHRCNRRQGFSAKSECRDSNEIGRLSDLGRAVAGERQRHVLRDHSRAVVTDADKFSSPVLQGDLDGRSAGVDRVLDELLYHGCRSLDYFAGGDLVGDGGRKYGDHRHGDIQTTNPYLVAAWE